MNHIYKVIWNTITQTWVAVSELSRAKGKTKSSKTLSAVVLAAVSAGAIVGDAEAAINYPQGTHTVNGMAIGANSYANRNSVAYGEAAKANDGYSVAIGANAVTNRVGSNEVGVSADRGMIAIGSNSVAKLEGATAIGSKAEAAGQQSTAVGNGAQAKGYNSSAFGEGAIAEKNYGVAVGKSANAKEQLGIAVGKNASAENYLSTAVGAKTQAKGESSIAIGSGDLNGGTDLDAPEGAKATGNASMAVGASAKATADNATALGKKATASGLNSIAAGATANASGTDSIATGHNANATGGNAVATGANASAASNAAAYGDNSKATGGWSSAFGNESKATATDASAFGNSANVSAQNGTAIGSHSTVTAINGTALGNQANVTIPGGVALGQGSSSSRTALNKNKVKITAGHVEDSEGISQNDDNNKNGDVYAPVKLIDKAEVLERVKNTIFGSAGAVSLGKDGETTRQLTNLAPGSKDSDAVNVAQLKAVVGSIVKYDVTSPDKSITIEPTSETDKYGNRKTTFNVKMNTTAVQNAAAWNLKEGSKNDNGEQVRGGDTVSFTDTETINVTRNGKQLTFNANTSSMSADGNNLGKIWTNDSNTRYLAKTKNVVDAINASGWILQANGKKVGLVNPGDKVNIATDANSGITITPTNENTNGVSTIKLKANVTNVVSANSNATITRDPNTGIVTVNAKDTNTQASVSKLNNNSPITIDSTGTNSAGAKDYKLDVNVDGTTITKTGGVLKAVIPAVEKVDLTVNKTGDKAGTVGTPENADKGKLVTAENVAKAVNESFWVAKKGDRVETNEDTTSDDSNVTAGSNVTFVAGKNIALQKDGNKFIYATKDNVTFTDVTTNNFTVNAGGNVNMGGNQIHNVKAGTAETDAVNVKQLNESVSTESVIKKASDDNIAEVAPGAGHTLKGKGAQYEVSVSKAKVREIAKEAVKVNTSTASDNPITVTPHTENGNVTYAVNVNKTDLSSATANGKITVPTDSGLVTAKDVANAINSAYWKLNVGDTDVQNVKAGDTVKFANGKGTTVEYDNTGKAIKVNANVTDITAGNNNITVKKGDDGKYTISATDTNTQASVSNATNSPITIDSDGTNSAGAKDYKLDVNVDGTTITKTGGVLKAVIPAVEKVDLTVNKTGNNAGKVEAPKDADKGKLVTAENVVKAVNESYWVAKKGDRVETNADTTSDDSNVTAGSNVTFVAGKNIALQKDGNKFIYATKDNVTFTDVTTNNFTVNAGGNVNMGGNQIHNVKAGTAETDAVNVKQLKSTERHITPNTYTYNDTDKSVTLTYTDGNGNLVKDTKAKIDLSGLASKIKDYSFKTNATGSNLVGTGADTTVASGKSVNFAASDNLTLKQDVNNGNVTYTYGLKNQVVVGEKGTPGADGKPGKDGVDGSIGVNGKDGSAVAINGKDGSIGLNGKDGKNGLTIKGDKGAFGVDGTNGKDGKDGMTRIVYTDNNNVKHEVATLDDGQKYAGDNYVAAKDNQAESNVIAKKANERLDIVGGAKGNLTEGNIGVNAKDGKLHVQLAEKVNLGDKGSVTIGDTVVNNNGITINSPADLNGVTNKTVSLTNQGLNNGGNKITNVAEGENDTDAVNVKQLKDFKSEVAEGGLTFAGNSGTAHKAKLNTTVNIKGGEGNTDADQFDKGKNVMTAVNGDTVTVSIKKTPEVEGINIIDTTGKVKVKLTQTDEGLKVSDGNNNATRITNVKAGEKDTDAVNVKQLNAAKTEVTAGDNIDVRSSTGANGQTIYKVSANDTSAAVEAGSDHVKVTKAANTHKDGSTTVTDYTVDLSDKTKGDIGKGVKAYDKVTNEGLTFNADKGSTGVKKLGSKVSVNGDGKNITTTADENGVKVSMKDDIKVNSVTAKEVKVGDVNINENGINAGGKRITNVAPGKDGTDAVNVNQLKYVAGNISNQINNVDKGLRAGIAGALASGGLYHVTTAGKSMVSVGAGTYRGQNALAVGYSRLSDNGKVGVKFTVNSNSQGHSGASASVGYQW
ncbi:ESPR-type extended signal peptide-containing protein [Haemophilus haemolyticus]|uniref:ESPR-type extended signal peptide-containing protein n=1 Tax=Haemophilus haemolyticus TaxID=726 RepID=UPI000E584280|nr:ESPR-type extended signal peptide-containing protein [Haemophilus haemolyticus]